MQFDIDNVIRFISKLQKYLKNTLMSEGGETCVKKLE